MAKTRKTMATNKRIIRQPLLPGGKVPIERIRAAIKSVMEKRERESCVSPPGSVAENTNRSFGSNH
jgi:hypothetical protein